MVPVSAQRAASASEGKSNGEIVRRSFVPEALGAIGAFAAVALVLTGCVQNTEGTGGNAAHRERRNLGDEV